jgi:hypothetical protein
MAVQERQRSDRIFLEVGNTAVASGSAKWTQTTFVRAVGGVRRGTERTNKAAGTLIKKVEFNINPSYSTPSERRKAPNGASGKFELERSLGFTYPCFISVFWADALGVAPLHIQYFTQIGDKLRAMRIIVQLPSKYSLHAEAIDPAAAAAGPDGSIDRSNPRSAGIPKGAGATYAASCGGGWVRYQAGGKTAKTQFCCPDGVDREHAPGARTSHDG